MFSNVFIIIYSNIVIHKIIVIISYLLIVTVLFCFFIKNNFNIALWSFYGVFSLVSRFGNKHFKEDSSHITKEYEQTEINNH